MKIKLFIVTYNAKEELHQTLLSLFNSDFSNHQNKEIFIINNHSNFSIDSEFVDKVTVLNNMCRPDFSTGHVARSWNQALLLGFKNLKNPDCDMLITCQDDTDFDPQWFSKLLELHKSYSFISAGAGDNLCSYTPDAVKKIGIWDERFCNVGFQEADYFTRAVMYNATKSSINDQHHGRVWNGINCNLVKKPQEGLLPRSIDSLPYHNISMSIYNSKYPHINIGAWDSAAQHRILSTKKPAIPTYMFYPYFEMDIEDLEGKGYNMNIPNLIHYNPK